jgi:hypothetical protein
MICYLHVGALGTGRLIVVGAPIQKRQQVPLGEALAD